MAHSFQCQVYLGAAFAQLNYHVPRKLIDVGYQGNLAVSLINGLGALVDADTVNPQSFVRLTSTQLAHGRRAVSGDKKLPAVTFDKPRRRLGIPRVRQGCVVDAIVGVRIVERGKSNAAPQRSVEVIGRVQSQGSDSTVARNGRVAVWWELGLVTNCSPGGQGMVSHAEKQCKDLRGYRWGASSKPGAALPFLSLLFQV